MTKLYPCGTGYELKEITPPAGYTLDPNSYPVGLEPGTVELAANDTAITVKEQIIKGKLLIVKQDALTQTLLAGAVFTVYDETGASVTGGSVLFDGLVANGKVYYRLTETSIQPGLSLLKDPVFQGTLPLEGETEKEYDISYTVTNNRITTLPQTGGSGLLLPVTIGTALLGLAGCTGFFVVRNYKKSKEEKRSCQGGDLHRRGDCVRRVPQASAHRQRQRQRQH